MERLILYLDAKWLIRLPPPGFWLIRPKWK